ncbi:glycine betaine/L-proline ABC transporter substrate-binding protein ProX [Zobellella aerophila]|uniref:Glycine betaine/L-proline ABC transporter substrate-binding protein ProX n=1 Tax=Zobellella aerophila TaxID=870480 RepID=A0ABP6V0B1_9GAMM
MQLGIKSLSTKVRALGAISLLTLSLANGANATSQPGNGTLIRPIFSSVVEERFRGEIAMAGLQELGYQVAEPKETEYATLMLAMAFDEADFSVHLWDILHDGFYQKAGGDAKLVKVGEVIPGVLQGYLIDKKTADDYDIRSLDDLKKPEIARLFDIDGDGKADLSGCNPGWGCEPVINHHIASYGLDKTVSHHRGPYFALMADTISRYQAGKPILYFTWVPQWISGVLVPGQDVQWLEVPYSSLPDGNKGVNTTFEGKNLGFAIDKVMAVMGRDFAAQNPAAKTFLSLVQLSAGEESAQNLKVKQGEVSPADIKRHAQEWISANRDTFDGWLEQARATIN